MNLEHDDEQRLVAKIRDQIRCLDLFLRELRTAPSAARWSDLGG